MKTSFKTCTLAAALILSALSAHASDGKSQQPHLRAYDLPDHDPIGEPQMADMSGMNMGHNEPNRIRLAPGEDAEIIWTFANNGTFEAACLIPGHYESGMFREVSVTH